MSEIFERTVTDDVPKDGHWIKIDRPGGRAGMILGIYRHAHLLNGTGYRYYLAETMRVSKPFGKVLDVVRGFNGALPVEIKKGDIVYCMDPELGKEPRGYDTDQVEEDLEPDADLVEEAVSAWEPELEPAIEVKEPNSVPEGAARVNWERDYPVYSKTEGGKALRQVTDNFDRDTAHETTEVPPAQEHDPERSHLWRANEMVIRLAVAQFTDIAALLALAVTDSSQAPAGLATALDEVVEILDGGAWR